MARHRDGDPGPNDLRLLVWAADRVGRLAREGWCSSGERGHRIDKVMERSPIGAAYARWTLVERPAFRPLAGSQTGLGL